MFGKCRDKCLLMTQLASWSEQSINRQNMSSFFIAQQARECSHKKRKCNEMKSKQTKDKLSDCGADDSFSTSFTSCHFIF